VANAYQVRASVNRWLDSLIPLNPDLTPADTLATQGMEGQTANEWHIAWDSERDGEFDQAWTRIFQIVRSRSDGDEIALDAELAACLTALGLDFPGRGALVPIYDYPAGSAVLTQAVVRRQSGRGWRYLPDPGDRPEYLRAAITLTVSYSA
jgi:hypothetical protein